MAAASCCNGLLEANWRQHMAWWTLAARGSLVVDRLSASHTKGRTKLLDRWLLGSASQFFPFYLPFNPYAS